LEACLCGENLILSAVGTVTADLKAICLGFLSILGMCFFMANASNSAQMCLANEPGDSEAFGQALAVSKDYLAVGDPKANRVILYQRNSEKGSWSRVREILPPKGSATEKAKAGFGYALDLSGSTLIVGAYDWIKWSQNSFLGAVYVAKIGTDKQVSIQEVVVPSNVTVGYSLSLFGEGKIAFAGSSEKRSNERLLIADLPSGKISRVIGAPQQAEEKSKWPQLESPVSVDFDGFGTSVAGEGNTLLIGAVGAPPRGGVYLASANGNVERIEFDDRKGLYQASTAGSPVVITENLIGIGRAVGIGIGDTLLLRRSVEGWSFAGVAALSGPLDAKGSNVLISLGRVGGMPSTPVTYPDHLLVRVDADGVVVESTVRWEPASEFTTKKNGVIDSNDLILSAEGKVVHVPLSNLSDSYIVRRCA
jgi:hypothetical protein